MAPVKDPDIVEEFQSCLQWLKTSDPWEITALTEIAKNLVDYYAAELVEGLVLHINSAPPNLKVLAIYLLDSMAKKSGRSYIPLFSEHLVGTFTLVFTTADTNTRKQLFTLRKSWRDFFADNVMYELDCSIRKIDPAWPIFRVLTPESSERSEVEGPSATPTVAQSEGSSTVHTSASVAPVVASTRAPAVDKRSGTPFTEPSPDSGASFTEVSPASGASSTEASPASGASFVDGSPTASSVKSSSSGVTVEVSPAKSFADGSPTPTAADNYSAAAFIEVSSAKSPDDGSPTASPVEASSSDPTGGNYSVASFVEASPTAATSDNYSVAAFTEVSTDKSSDGSPTVPPVEASPIGPTGGNYAVASFIEASPTGVTADNYSVAAFTEASPTGVTADNYSVASLIETSPTGPTTANYSVASFTEASPDKSFADGSPTTPPVDASLAGSSVEESPLTSTSGSSPAADELSRLLDFPLHDGQPEMHLFDPEIVNAEAETFDIIMPPVATTTSAKKSSEEQTFHSAKDFWQALDTFIEDDELDGVVDTQVAVDTHPAVDMDVDNYSETANKRKRSDGGDVDKKENVKRSNSFFMEF